MDGEAAGGNALSGLVEGTMSLLPQGGTTSKVLFKQLTYWNWIQGAYSISWGSEDMVQRGGLFDDERLAFDVGSAVAEQVIAQQAGRGDLQDGNALAPTGIARPETPLMAYVDRASFPGFLDETEFKCALGRLGRSD
ncbi:unnamed protein product [Cladocopium goreaui]|uniref:Uncharacterized protein n=1 Tax=Cladocopium goreaui TaxID=2562237 RepID=A0A9P1DI82_9DINO|nr:unnamed protein product [Cladocopium goreaui]